MVKVAVLGGGHGAHTIAADLSLRGFQVKLFEMERFERNIRKVLSTKEIEIYGDISKHGVAKLEDVTLDIDRAIKEAEFIFIPVPAYAHEVYARLLADKVSEDQIIVLFPGTFGTLEFKNIFQRRNKTMKL